MVFGFGGFSVIYRLLIGGVSVMLRKKLLKHDEAKNISKKDILQRKFQR